MQQPAPSYDPATRKVVLPPDASAYQTAHELAHAAQHRQRTPAWKAHEIAGTWIFAGRFIRLWVEWEASRYALRALALVGRCDRHARSEARWGIFSYVRALFFD